MAGETVDEMSTRASSVWRWIFIINGRSLLFWIRFSRGALILWVLQVLSYASLYNSYQSYTLSQHASFSNLSPKRPPGLRGTRNRRIRRRSWSWREGSHIRRDLTTFLQQNGGFFYYFFFLYTRRFHPTWHFYLFESNIYPFWVTLAGVY